MCGREDLLVTKWRGVFEISDRRMRLYSPAHGASHFQTNRVTCCICHMINVATGISFIRRQVRRHKTINRSAAFRVSSQTSSSLCLFFCFKHLRNNEKASLGQLVTLRKFSFPLFSLLFPLRPQSPCFPPPHVISHLLRKRENAGCSLSVGQMASSDSIEQDRTNQRPNNGWSYCVVGLAGTVLFYVLNHCGLIWICCSSYMILGWCLG